MASPFNRDLKISKAIKINQHVSNRYQCHLLPNHKRTRYGYLYIYKWYWRYYHLCYVLSSGFDILHLQHNSPEKVSNWGRSSCLQDDQVGIPHPFSLCSPHISRGNNWSRKVQEKSGPRLDDTVGTVNWIAHLVLILLWYRYNTNMYTLQLNIMQEK